MIKRAFYPSFEPSLKMREEAKIRADKIPPNIKNSIRKGEGRYVGALGEVVFMHYCGGVESTGRSVYHFDVILKDGKVCEVKTKERTVAPRSTYECSVAKFNDSQECDYYVFASALNDYSKVWLLGYLSREEFKEVAIFRKEGEIDPSNNQTCSADCWNVKINQLHDIKDLLK